uniref:DNA-binding protein n=1 Tax=Globodera pallida TaxID=36090 RepID=A0A183BPU2_GLOPA
MDNVIATIEILSEHTGEEIARLIENFLVENGLSIGSIVACVRDDALRDALRCNDRITNLIAKVRKWKLKAYQRKKFQWTFAQDGTVHF